MTFLNNKCSLSINIKQFVLCELLGDCMKKILLITLFFVLCLQFTSAQPALLEPPDGRVYHGVQLMTYETGGDPLAGYLGALNDQTIQPAVRGFFFSIPGERGPANTFMGLKNFFHAADSIGFIPEISIFFIGKAATDSIIAVSNQYDYILDSIITLSKNYGKKMFLRIGGEFNGAGPGWNGGGYHPYLYVTAFRKVVDKFAARGFRDSVATNWCYEPDAANDFDSVDTKGARWYPGDNYCDWFGLDVFDADHFDKAKPDFDRGTITKKGKSERFLAMARTKGKPVFMSETSAKGINISNDNQDGINDWNNWFAKFWEFIDLHKEIKGFGYINANWPAGAYPNWGDSRIQNSPYVTGKYKEEMKNPKYIHLNQQMQNGPWNSPLKFALSNDGTNFNSEKIFQDSAGVPSVIKWKGDTLACVFQWFRQPVNSLSWDRVAVKFSYNLGITWTEPVPIVVTGIPANYQRPFDPTLTVIENNKLRIYFSSSDGIPKGMDTSINTYSATSSDGINYQFESGARYDNLQSKVIDPAVIYFNNEWHYLSPAGAPQDGAFHCTSTDGLVFTEKLKIQSDNTHNWTGNFVVENSEELRFYGCGQNIWFNKSNDGFVWNSYTNTNIKGGDPSVVKLAENNYLMVFVGQSNNQINPPGKVILSSPDNYSGILKTQQLLSWHYVPDAVKYQLQIKNNNITVFNDSTISDTSYNFTKILNFSPYYWKVRAGNSKGWGMWSDEWSFMIIDGVEDDEQNKQQNDLIISPNPAIDFIEISLSGAGGQGMGNREQGTDPRPPSPDLRYIQIYNSMGEMVMKLKVEDNQSLRIDVSFLPLGIYFVRVGEKVMKFVKI
ncbi:MAG: hypothetical protein HW421_795 [Ignavibacteria bacterium]|nr:hypothetical protein [Ignavibacteria bacterium]